MSKAPQIRRFGTIESLSVHKTAKGLPYAKVMVNCSKFKQEAVAFGDAMVSRLKGLGEGAKITFRGVLEPTQKKNETGGTYTEERMKIVFIVPESTKADTAEAAEDVDASAEAAEESVAEAA